MRNVLLIALREFKATAMTKSFIFGIVFPFILGGIIYAVFGLKLLADKPPVLQGAIAVIDATPGQIVATALPARLTKEAQKDRREDAVARLDRATEEAGVSEAVPPGAAAAGAEVAERILGVRVGDVRVEPYPPDADSESLKDRVRRAELVAVIHVTPKTLEPGGDYELFVGPDANRKISDTLRDSVEAIVIDHRFTSQGFDKTRIQALLEPPRARTLTVSETGEKASTEKLQFIVPMVFIMLLLTGAFTGGQYLLMSTIEEKSSRVMEVLLSAATPMQLMSGKIFGQGLVGLTLLVVYAGLGIVAAFQFDVSHIIRPQDLVWLVIYFLLAYFMIAALFASIGSAVSEMREAQTLMGPVMALLIVPVYIVLFSVENPNSKFNVVASFIPPVAPFAMMLRLSQTGSPVPTWQVVVSTAICVAAVIAMIWLAAKIFRVGVLMYGKPPSLIGLIKWVRYS